MDIRNFMFSNRSFTPVPIALAIIFLSDPSILYFIYGMPLILIGELIRINAVSHAGGITRTMNEARRLYVQAVHIRGQETPYT